jgi:hypothetical protein
MGRLHWPNEEEIAKLQAEEDERAEVRDDFADPICDCGEPGFACRCEALASRLGFWSNGFPYDLDE